MELMAYLNNVITKDNRCPISDIVQYPGPTCRDKVRREIEATFPIREYLNIANQVKKLSKYVPSSYLDKYTCIIIKQKSIKLIFTYDKIGKIPMMINFHYYGTCPGVVDRLVMSE